MATHTGLTNIKADDTTFADDVTVTGDLTVTAATALNGNVTVGNATSDTVGFYGVTAVAQRASASQAAVSATFATAVATTTLSQAYTGMWAFASSTVAQTWRTKLNQARVDIAALATLVNRMRADLVAVGLIKGAA